MSKNGVSTYKEGGGHPAISIDLKLDPQSDVLQTAQLVTSLVTIEEMGLHALTFKGSWRTPPPQ